VLSPYFRVSPSNVLLESKNSGIDINIAYRSIEEIYGKSIFLINEEDIALTLKKSLKNLSHLSINKLYPNGVKILMTSAPIVFEARIFGFEKTWLMTNNGVLIPKNTTPQTESAVVNQYIHLEIISESLR